VNEAAETESKRESDLQWKQSYRCVCCNEWRVGAPTKDTEAGPVCVLCVLKMGS